MIIKSWKDSKILQYQFKEEYPLASVNKKGDVEMLDAIQLQAKTIVDQSNLHGQSIVITAFDTPDGMPF